MCLCDENDDTFQFYLRLIPYYLFKFWCIKVSRAERMGDPLQWENQGFAKRLAYNCKQTITIRKVAKEKWQEIPQYGGI